MRLTGRQKRPLEGGLILAAVLGGMASSESLSHGLGVALAVLLATCAVVAVIRYADRDERQPAE